MRVETFITIRFIAQACSSSGSDISSKLGKLSSPPPGSRTRGRSSFTLAPWKASSLVVVPQRLGQRLDAGQKAEAIDAHAQRASDHDLNFSRVRLGTILLGTILGRERRLWNQAVMDRSGLANTLRDAPIRQAAECLTLVSLNEGVASRDRTSALLGACPRLAGLDAATLGAIADIFHELYEREERDDWARGVTPDLLGTFLLRETDDGLLRNLFSTTILSDREATNALTKLNWLAQEWPEAGRAKLLSAFAADPARLLPLAMQVAIESSDPIGGLAAAHLQSHPDIDLAREIDRSMPHRTTALRELATVATELLHGSAGRDDLDDMAERAGTANNLSVRLSDLGRREEALAAVEEAVALYRELATARPDAFRPDLATALTNLSNRLSDLERREEALAAVTEAVAIRRDLATARPDAFRPDLAGTFNSLSNRLSSLGRREEALAAVAEAVAIRRDLATARPDAFRPDLAMSLNNLAGDLSLLGRREEALAAVTEAVALYRDLATARPDAFRPDLAGTLNNLSIFQSDLGRREEAVAAAVEAVALTRDLATARPDAFRPVLAMSLYNLALSSNEAGRREEAVLAAREAVDLYHGLVQVYPDAFGDNLADAQGLLSELGEETDGG